MSFMTSGALVVGALAVLIACSGSQPSSSGPAVIDSAGVEIVTNRETAPEEIPSWQISSVPTREIGGGADPEIPVSRVVAVTPLGEGRVAVGTASPAEVLVFEGTGTLVARLGREGDGPGEFESVASVVQVAVDTVAIWDPDRRRVSVYATSGDLAKELDLSGFAPMSAASAGSSSFNSGYTHLLPTTSGDMVLFGEGAIDAGQQAGVTRPELPAMRISREGKQLAEYGRFPGMEVIQPGGFPRPLGLRTHGATVGDALVVGTAEATEVRVFGPDGSLERIVRWPEHDRSVGGAHLARWSDFVDEQPEMAEMVRALPHPESFPAYGEIVGAASGELLISAYPGPLGVWPLRRADDAPEMLRPRMRVPARTWWVFDSNGEIAARLDTPEGFEPYSFEGSEIWGVYTDELDVESVRAYRLDRGAA